MESSEILNARQISQKLNRISYQIYEHHLGEKEIFIAGIEGNGYIIAKRITEILKKISPLQVKIGKIKINKNNPLAELPRADFKALEFKNKSVILIDDVMNSGKTLFYALKVFLETPVKRISTAVLVDRSHTVYPIKIDFVGLSLSTTLQEHISAELEPKGNEKVILV
jgi:pyrimidine operon attenuation protein / uracil phosphoribosyltransferase